MDTHYSPNYTGTLGSSLIVGKFGESSVIRQTNYYIRIIITSTHLPIFSSSNTHKSKLAKLFRYSYRRNFCSWNKNDIHNNFHGRIIIW